MLLWDIAGESYYNAEKVSGDSAMTKPVKDMARGYRFYAITPSIFLYVKRDTADGSAPGEIQ